MRILHLIGSMDPKTGGPCQGIRLAAPISEDMSVYREVVCGDEPMSAYLGTDPFPVHALGGMGNPWCYSPELLPWLRKNVHRFDAVITNGLWLYHAQAVRKVLKEEEKEGRKKPKWYVMPHGMLDPYFQKATDRRWKAFRNWIYWKLLERKTISQSDGLLFTCETELLVARTTFTGYAPKRERNVGYGVSSPPVYNDIMREAFLEICPEVTDKPYLLFLSRIHTKKGVDLLIDAYSKLADKSVENNYCLPYLVIAGPGGDTPYGQSLQRLVRKNSKVKNMIFFTGMLQGDAKWGAFYGCEASVLPSHQENFGITVAESLACAKPVLISNQVNIWREIEAGGGGLVTSNTQAGTFQLLKNWVSMPKSEQKKMSTQAKAVFEKHFTIVEAVSNFVKEIGDSNKKARVGLQ
ncbi:glycosyltransferase [uncultured Fibrella sp.]|uniref:glycosyltransferase n=1 Tax=uncultured Fibrella sp. TaxID=1284596 RepID=UPI0035CA004F